jgi:hypothetical protein
MKYRCQLRMQVIKTAEIVVEADNADEAYEQAEETMLREKFTIEWAMDSDPPTDDDMYEVCDVEEEA